MAVEIKQGPMDVLHGSVLDHPPTRTRPRRAPVSAPVLTFTRVDRNLQVSVTGPRPTGLATDEEDFGKYNE